MKKLSVLILLLIFPLLSFAALPNTYKVRINQAIAKYLPENAILRPDVLRSALEAYDCALLQGVSDDKGLLTIIDYSLPSSIQRMWVIDIKNKTVLYHTFVAHGKYSGTGTGKAVRFSNKPNSLESSIGLFRTAGTYFGHDGYSLILKGLEPGFNDKVQSRHIIMHGAWYVSKATIQKYGRIGRSWGCPALDEKIVKPVINHIKDGTLLFIYYPQKKWLSTSRFLQCSNLN